MMEKRSRSSAAAVNSPELYLSPEDWARLQAVTPLNGTPGTLNHTYTCESVNPNSGASTNNPKWEGSPNFQCRFTATLTVFGNGGSTTFWDVATFGLIDERSQHLVLTYETSQPDHHQRGEGYGGDSGQDHAVGLAQGGEHEEQSRAREQS